MMFEKVIPLVSLICNYDVIGDNNVGNACRTNANCSKNEFCLAESNLDPPCPSGYCHCLPQHELASDCTSPKNIQCADMVLMLGDRCCNPPNVELPDYSPRYVFPPGAHCGRNNRVVCRPFFMQLGENCLANTDMLPGSPCLTHSDCPGDLICEKTSTQTCQCPVGYRRYDMDSGNCIPKEYGDYCEAEDDCNTYGSRWEGFTYESGSCSSESVCICSSNNAISVMASYLDRRTGSVRNKTICVVGDGAQTHLDVGEDCHLDPIFAGRSPYVRICAAGLICHTCPNEAGVIMGKCRRVLPPSQTKSLSLSKAKQASSGGGGGLAQTATASKIIEIGGPFIVDPDNEAFKNANISDRHKMASNVKQVLCSLIVMYSLLL